MDKDTINYFRSLYNDCDGMVVAVSDFVNHNFIPAEKIAESVGAIIQGRAGNWFHGFHPLKTAPARGRGTSADVAAIMGAFIDVDVGSEADGSKYAAGKNPELTLEELKALFVDGGLPLPSAIVSTGNGYHFEWRLDRPFSIAEPTDRKRAVAFLRGFDAQASAIGLKHGLKFDSMGDLARLKRVAGSQNYKDRGNPKPVRLMEFEPSRRYALSTLEALLPSEERQRPVSAARTRSAPAEQKQPSWDAVVAACAFAQHIEHEAEALPEPQWHAAASLVGQCEGGEARFHALSARDPRYDQRETAAKLERAITDAEPRSCAEIHEGAPAFDGCKGCPFYGRLRSPIGLGYEKPEVSQLLASYVLDNETARYFAWSDLAPLPEPAFIRAKRHLGLANAAVAFQQSKRAIIADRTDYLPGGPKLVSANGRTILNTWRPSDIQPIEGDCSTILQHFEYLFPDAAERDHLLNYYAHLVQAPAVKIAHAVLIMGRRQGTGKSMAVSPLRTILGAANVASVSNQMVKTPWTADYADVQLAVVEELMGNDRLSLYNDLKEWITEETASANQKNVVSRTARTPRGWIFITNHSDPLLLDRGDRRLFVLETEAEPRDKAYYDRLAAALSAELPAFLHWLVERDLSGFSPKAQPPMTAAKERLQELATPPVERVLREAWESASFDFRRDIGTLADAKSALLLFDSTLSPLKDREVIKALGGIGARKLAQVRIGASAPYIWVWRNHERWAVATSAELREAYATPLAPILSAVA